MHKFEKWLNRYSYYTAGLNDEEAHHAYELWKKMHYCICDDCKRKRKVMNKQMFGDR